MKPKITMFLTLMLFSPTISEAKTMPDSRTWILVTKTYSGIVSIKTGLTEAECKAAREVLIFKPPTGGGLYYTSSNEISSSDAHCVNAAEDTSLNLDNRKP